MFEEIVQIPGFLTDRQIEAALKSGFLIEEGSWEASQIRHASYTLGDVTGTGHL